MAFPGPITLFSHKWLTLILIMSINIEQGRYDVRTDNNEPAAGFPPRGKLDQVCKGSSEAVYVTDDPVGLHPCANKGAFLAR